VNARRSPFWVLAQEVELELGDPEAAAVRRALEMLVQIARLLDSLRCNSFAKVGCNSLSVC
jgi:hypothetical protein